MAIQYNENIKLAAPNPLDKRYLSNRLLNGSQLPYSSTTEVYSTVIQSERYLGMPVNILGVEYWFKNGVTNLDLIEKIYDTIIPETDYVTGATNLGFFNGYSGIQTLPITNIPDVNYNGYYNSIYNNYYRGVDGKIHTGAASDGISRRGYLKTFGTVKSFIWNEYVGSNGNLKGWILIDGNVENKIGTFQSVFGAAVYYNGVTTFPYTGDTWTSGIGYNNGSNMVISVVTGSLTTGSTVNTGNPIYYNTTDNLINLRSIKSITPEHIKLSFDESFVYVSGATSILNAQNVGGGREIFSQKIGNDLQFRSIIGSGDTVVSQVGDTINIFSSGGDGTQIITGASNIGSVSGVGLYDGVVNKVINLRKLVGSGNTSISSVGDDVIINTSGSTYNLTDLNDVSISSPSPDYVLKWNGSVWTDSPSTTISASAGVNFYNSTPILISRTLPAGISDDGILGNGIQISSLSKIPVTSGGTQLISGLASGDTRAFIGWVDASPIGKTMIDSGTWKFSSYLSVDVITGLSVTTLIRQVYQVVPVTTTITTSGVSANVRTATITSNQFSGAYFTTNVVNTVSSWLQTSSGIYQIIGISSTNEVTIVVPTGYVNENAVSGNIWNKLFDVETSNITSTYPTPSLYEISTTQSAFTISVTDRLGQIGFVRSNDIRTIYWSYNGNTQASHFNTPLLTQHNEISGLQGGNGNERFHVDLEHKLILDDTSGINTGDETKSTIESKLTGEILTHTHPYSGITGAPNINEYQTVSGFTAYTATTNMIINSAISGVTSVGTGVSVYSGITGRNIVLNKIVGSGNTSVNKVNENIIIYSTGSDTLFSDDIVVSVAAGKTFGRYVNGDIIPASGKTATQVIQMALSEALSPTISLSSSGNNVVFGESGKTVNLNFGYVINTQGASVVSTQLEYRRGGSWNLLNSDTGATTYIHSIDDSGYRFDVTLLEYRYTVLDSAGASGQTTHTVTPQTYSAPTISPTYVGGILSYETQSIRELGNINTTIGGNISSNRSLVKLLSYLIQRSVDGGGYVTIASATTISALTKVITTHVDSGATNSALSISYRVQVVDEYTTSISSVSTITFRFASYYGYSTNVSLTGAQIVGLGNQVLSTSRARTMTLTAPTSNYTYVSYPSSFGDLTSAIMDGSSPVLGAFTKLSNVNVTNGYGQTVSNIVYKSNAPAAFTNNVVAFT